MTTYVLNCLLLNFLFLNNKCRGEAKMHIGEAMKSLQAGDIEGAKMHACTDCSVCNDIINIKIEKKKQTAKKINSIFFNKLYLILMK